MRKLIAGNWKMNGLSSSFETLNALLDGLSDDPESEQAEALICPPFTLIGAFAARCKGTKLKIGAQNCHAAKSGAHTGDVSAPMLADSGARYVILGHSERRADYGETDKSVAARVIAALDAGLEPIICVGENLSDREAGRTMDVVLAQLAGSLPDALIGKAFTVAYEPVWAIGTGLTATIAQISEVHLAIRQALVQRFGEAGRAARILYGGSMKPDNAKDILSTSNVDGGLIGGASLKSEDFLAIYRTAQ